jgi:hypothetical protein
LYLATNNQDEVKTTWQYVYSHGCIGKQANRVAIQKFGASPSRMIDVAAVSIRIALVAWLLVVFARGPRPA